MNKESNKEETLDTIKQQINENPVILYMKGSPEMPQCGFSNKAVQLLKACGHPFAYIDILQNPDIRAILPDYADWPTFPQLYVAGELLGGSDILEEMYEEGELQDKIDAAVDNAKKDSPIQEDEGYNSESDES